MIIYTDKFIPEHFGAVTRGPFILVRPDQKGNKAIIAHEKVHRLQWFVTLGLSPFLYLIWPWFRMWAEVHAYRAGLKHKPWALETYAQALSAHYRLDITIDKARELIKG